MAVQQLLVSKTTTMPWLEPQSRLRLDRQDIVFYNVAERRVRIQVTIHNDGDADSRPTFAQIQSADFGAFLPWRPLTRLPVPAIVAGDSVTLQIDAEIAPLTADTLRPPAAKSRTTENPADHRRESMPLLIRRALNAFMEVRSRGAQPRPVPRPGMRLSPDIYEVDGRPLPNWAGNLNVFVGRESVERHMARGLRIDPGCVNLAHFHVGSGPDAYSFEMPTVPEGWKVSLTHGERSMFFATDPITPGTWIEARRSFHVMALMELPESCAKGSVEITVQQRSTGKEAVVEFELDADGPGSGCHMI
jgi:hypothetical protein